MTARQTANRQRDNSSKQNGAPMRLEISDLGYVTLSQYSDRSDDRIIISCNETIRDTIKPILKPYGARWQSKADSYAVKSINSVALFKVLYELHPYMHGRTPGSEKTTIELQISSDEYVTISQHEAQQPTLITIRCNKPAHDTVTTMIEGHKGKWNCQNTVAYVPRTESIALFESLFKLHVPYLIDRN